MEAGYKSSSRRLPVILAGIFVWVLIAATVALSVVGGMRLRRWTWGMTDPIRYQSDIRRGCMWGLQASGPEGYLNQYEKMDLEEPLSDPWLDYAPLRLMVMWRWGAWLRQHHPPDPGSSLQYAWQPDYEYTAPVLRFNAAMDALAAVCAFFLTRLWVRRGSEPEKPAHFRGMWQGLTAALLLWFSPAIIISAHGWPTWDSWIIPFYLLAALLASLDWWFFAGMALAVGAMFKGQQLTMIPIFLVWPLIQRKWNGAVRFIAGFVITFAAIASPWLLSYLPADQLAAARQVQDSTAFDDYPPDLFAISCNVDWGAVTWITGLVVATVAGAWMARRSKWWKLATASGAFVLTIWPWMLNANRPQWMIGVGVAVALAAAVCYVRPRNLPYILAIGAGGGLLMCMDLFHGSTAWWDCGFHFGTIHWPTMIMGDTSNLPGIFNKRFGWSSDVTETAFILPAVNHLWPDVPVTTKTLFNTIFGVLLTASAVGVGLQARWKDRRMLVALTTPWLMFFLFPVQIHERYLLFAAGVSAICIGQSVGMALLGLFLTFVTAIMTLNVMLDHGDLAALGQNLAEHFPRIFSPSAGDTIYMYIQGAHPDIGWGVLVAAAIFLWISLTPSGSRMEKTQ
jgi:hypothetical protein